MLKEWCSIWVPSFWRLITSTARFIFYLFYNLFILFFSILFSSFIRLFDSYFIFFYFYYLTAVSCIALIFPNPIYLVWTIFFLSFHFVFFFFFAVLWISLLVGSIISNVHEKLVGKSQYADPFPIRCLSISYLFSFFFIGFIYFPFSCPRRKTKGQKGTKNTIVETLSFEFIGMLLNLKNKINNS